MKRVLLTLIILILTLQSVIAGNNYNATQQDIKIISSLNSKIEKIIKKNGVNSASVLLDKLLKIEEKIQHDERLAYIIKKIIQNTTLQITIYEVNNYENTSHTSSSTANNLKVKIYDDKRCHDCGTENLLERLKTVPGLKNANFDKKDFSDPEVKDYLKENNIKNLPLIIFPNNFIDPGLNEYLRPIDSGEYYLDINASFNPFVERSSRGYVVLSDSNLKVINQETKYFKGNKQSNIAWFEYTNFACPACKHFHQPNGMYDKAFNKYSDRVKYATKHFHFFDAAYPAAEVIECAAEQLGDEGFYALEKNIFIDGVLTVDALSEKAIELGANKSELNACLESDKHIQTYESVKDNGARIFGVSATPTNILINLETGEFMKTQNVGADIQKFIGE